MEIQTDGTYSRGISVWVTEDDPEKAAEMKEQPEKGTPVHRMLNAGITGNFSGHTPVRRKTGGGAADEKRYGNFTAGCLDRGSLP